MGVLSEDEEMHLHSDDDDDSVIARKDTETKKSSRRQEGDSITSTLYGSDKDAKAKAKASMKSSGEPARMPDNSTSTVGTLYGTDADAKSKVKASKANSGYASVPGMKIFSPSAHSKATISTLYGGDSDAKAKAKASRGDSKYASNPGVLKKKKSSRGSFGAAASVDSKNSEAVSTLYGTDDSDAKAKTKPSKGDSRIARNTGVSTVPNSSSHSATSTLYGTDADAKAKTKVSRTNPSILSNHGMESVSLPAIPTATVVDEIGIVEDLSIGRTDSESASNSDPPPRSTNSRQDTQQGVMDIERVTVVPNDPELTSSRRSSSDQNIKRENRKPKGSRKKRVALLLFFLLLVGGGIAIWLFLFKNKKDHQDSRIGSSNIRDPTSAPSSSTVSSEPPSGVGAWTTSPTKLPVIEGLLFQPPTEDNCEAIAKNETIAGREEMEDADFGLGLEVVLSGESTMTQPLVYELLSAIQEKILPSLAGCNINLDEFVEDWRFVIFDAFVSGNVQPDERCKDENLATQNCHLMAIQLDLFLKGRVRFLDIIDLISDEEVNIANHLGLTDVFSIVKLVQIDNLTPTSSPTIMPSDVPSWTPSESPSGQGTAKPTLLPTARPTSRATEAPTGSPITLPTLAPSVVSATALPVANPSPATTDLPTSSPSTRPSETPSTVPSSLPSKTPSAIPSESPSALPSSEPSTVPSTRPSSVPSGSPSTTPSALPSISPSNVPSISPSTTPSMQPSIASFYWVACGRVGFCRNKTATVQNANYMFVGGIPSDRKREQIAVRCCSETKLPGFAAPQDESCPFVDSKIGGRINGTCYNTTSYYEADSICSTAGARLCTLNEIQGNCTADTGCGHNRRMVWSSTPGP